MVSVALVSPEVHLLTVEEVESVPVMMPDQAVAASPPPEEPPAEEPPREPVRDEEVGQNVDVTA